MLKVNVKLLTACTLGLVTFLIYHSSINLQGHNLQNNTNKDNTAGKPRFEIDSVDFEYDVDEGLEESNEETDPTISLKKPNSFKTDSFVGDDLYYENKEEIEIDASDGSSLHQAAYKSDSKFKSQVKDHNSSINTRSSNESRCKPIINICYIKVHKSSSTTISNIFQRFGYTRKLTFVLPNKLVNIGYPSAFKVDSGLPRPESKAEFNLLVNHAVFHEENMKSVMPKGTVFIGSYREPFSHLLSSYNYFKLERLNGMPDVRTFLSDPAKYDNSRLSGMSFTRGYQAWHYGYNPLSHSQESLTELIEQIDRTFSIILISEYLNMSLLLMKRLLCWELKDILYVSKKILSYPDKYAVYKESDIKRFEKWNDIDYLLYDNFNQSLWSKINKQGKDFFDELNNYEKLLDRISDVCNESVFESEEATNQILEYDEVMGVSVTKGDCILMLTSSQNYVRVFTNRQYTKSEILRFHDIERANEVFAHKDVLPDVDYNGHS